MRRGGSLLIAPLCLVALVSCNNSEERKALERFAGAYQYEMSGKDVTMTKTLTLRPDGSATMSSTGDLGGSPISGTLQGTYVVNGTNLTARFMGPDGGVFRFRIAGDTLIGQPTATELAIANSSGMDPQKTEQALVRIP